MAMAADSTSVSSDYLAPEQYDAWLAAPVPQMRGFLRCWPAEDLSAVPDPQQIGHPTKAISQPLLF